MKAEHEKYHLIDRYLRGELEGEELEAFEQDLAIDSDFIEDLEFQQEVNEMISANAYHELRQQMSGDINEIDRRNTYKKWLGGSLIVAILLSSSAYFIFKGNQAKKVVKQDNRSNTIEEIKSIIPNVERKEVEKDSKHIDSQHNSNPKKYNAAIAGQVASVIPAPVEQNTSQELKQEVLEKHELKAKSEEKSNQTGINLCSSVKIIVPYTVEKACTQKKDGKFILDDNSINGGKEPYLIELYHGTQKISGLDYLELQSGNYTLRVTDQNGCSDSWNIAIGEKSCKAKDVSIHPSNGEKVEFDGNEGESYYLTIYNQAGQMVYKSSLLSGNSEWTGLNNSGSTVGTGLYVYILEYTNGKKESGQITVIE